ncbi:threonylcarbamoyl-AMP synthase [Candidatus Tenderia electrophaga]|jgi:tRNA threonylcarbamoyl adenosine modification protein (Sua5/YciO/YrdC/YwlC family)|uniref:Threonylcarbamoyl-AMP synthase n=1 Tax=Candidatus Tenderia electrophaga TaxID=1748243 RepID=A0A0S2TE59_9GAMM|nr:threonylcarbamoyl-AMP synthase [Candidatus Tenderia electrophaga]
MSQFFQIHPETPQQRLIRGAVEIIRQGGVVIYPTDSCYAFGCQIGDKKAVERIRRIRSLDDKHNFTLMCRDLSEMSDYAQIDNIAYRFIKGLTPGPYTFVLPAMKVVPKRLLHPKRKTIGVRMPDNAIALALLDALGEPILSSTMILPGDEFPMIDPYDMRDTVGHQVDLIIDGGYCGLEPTTVIELLDETPEVVRRGKGADELVL